MGKDCDEPREQSCGLLYYRSMEENITNLSDWSGVLISRNTVEKRTLCLAQYLHIFIKNGFIISPIREGGIYFWGKLVPLLKHKPKVINLKVVSYRDNRLPGTPVLEIPDDYPAQGNKIVLVDDIVDTGGTQSALTHQLLLRKAKEVRMICLLDKPSRRRFPVTPAFSGFVIPNLYVFGCGMDWQGRFRDLLEIRYYRV
jgi:hypoxanthine phosphoribosyltransferase